MNEFSEPKRTPGDLKILLAGDIVLDADDPDHWLAGIAPALRSADIAIGHLEVPHTHRGVELTADVPATAPPPEHLDALLRAGITAVSLAGNHIADRGGEGIADTIERLDALGIAHTGAGQSIGAARVPAIVECRGRVAALLSYNCVGPQAAWASESRAGCNYLLIHTADGSPVTPNAALTEPADEALATLRADIAAARQTADIVIVALHKGIVHTPAKLAPYEQPIADAALAAGAHVVVGHHAHILRGIEIRDDRCVFHGLGNGCVVTSALSPDQDHPVRSQWALRRRELFGFEPDPDYPLAPFHPEAVHGALGVVLAFGDGRQATGVVPVFVEPPGRPVCVEDERADRVIAYIRRIGMQAGLRDLHWQRSTADLWMCS
ncbi:MAG TPA: CapA family protein [Gammaproteobacteria bacterium]|nr:CapA family protein [Gammaproteobacteria bacterium]